MTRKIVVFEEPLSRHHKAARLSLIYLFIVLCRALVILLPFFLFLHSSGGLWLKEGTYREQPDVKFLYQYIITLETASTTAAASQTKEIFVSNQESVAAQRIESYRAANIEFNENDIDLDGRLDSFTLEADVPLGEDEQVVGMQAVLFFNYKLEDRVKFDTESVAHISFGSGLPLSGYDSKGTLELRQAKPLGIRDYSSTLYAEETPLVNDSTSNIDQILEKYRERTVAVDYKEQYPIKTRANNSEENSKFHLKMNIDVPEQNVMYIPTLVEVLKDGWVKYLSVLVLCWYLVENIKRFVFSNHLLPCAVFNPVKGHTEYSK